LRTRGRGAAFAFAARVARARPDGEAGQVDSAVQAIERYLDAHPNASD